MKTNKILSEDSLRELFSQISFEEPAPDFSENLLLRIEKEVLREKRKQNRMLVAQVAAGVFGILILPALAIYLCTIFLPDFSFSFPKMHLHFDSKLLSIGGSVLMLLIVDTLLRMRAENGSNRDSK